MIIIADSNIFMSALISPNGETASILAERKKIQYIVPDYLITEVTEHIPDIVKRLKNQKTKRQLLADFKELLEGVTITFRSVSFFISISYKNFLSSPSSGENTSTQIIHLRQNTLSNYQNNGVIRKLTNKLIG